MRGFNQEKSDRSTSEMLSRQKAYYFYEKYSKKDGHLSNPPYLLIAERRYRDCLKRLRGDEDAEEIDSGL